MKFQFKLFEQKSTMLNFVIAGLCLFFGASIVHAADPYDTNSQVSMLTQTSSRESINRELQALEEEYINDVISSLQSEPKGPDFSRNEVYISHLADVIAGKTQQNQPNFADDEVYLNHLVSILVK